MRIEIIDWIFNIARNKLISPKVFSNNKIHLGIILMDKYIIINSSEKDFLKEIGLVCLLIANKLEDSENVIYLDIIKNLLYNNSLEELELKIINKLNFNLLYDTMPKSVYLLENTMNKKQYYLCIFLIDILLYSSNYRCFSQLTLGNKVIDFVLLLKETYNNSYTYEINEEIDGINSFIYLSWLNFNKSGYIYYSEYLSKEELKEPFVKSNKENYYLIEQPDILINLITKPNFILEEIIGEGTYGTVYKVNETTAIKLINNEKNSFGIDDSILLEINALLKLKHKNIIRMNWFWYDNKYNTIRIGFELMDKTLYEYLDDNVLSNEDKENLIIQLLEGINYIHNNNIIHRDLSPNNIMISKNNILKITDFGSSRYLDPHFWISDLSKCCGNIFKSFEMLNKKEYNYKSDVWAAACIIVYILQNDYLFKSRNSKEVLKEIKEFKESRLSLINDKYKNILIKMLNNNPEERITINEALNLFKNEFN